MEEFRRYTCPTCGGVSHPASGCAYTENFVVCGPCTRQAWVWLQGVTASKGRRRNGISFYDHVNRIHPPITIEVTP